MLVQHHPLPANSAGQTFALESLHFGSKRSGRKTYIQASLHADEVPGMLVAHYLRQNLSELEAQDKIHGEIVLVPTANPIGLGQFMHGHALGRFDLATGTNFNRGFRNLVPELVTRLEGELGDNAIYNIRTVRQAARQILNEWPAISTTDVLKKTLQTLAIDADIVLDLHCDNEAVLHLYTGTPLANQVQPLGALMAAQALLLARASGDDPFDESCSRHWWELAEHFGAKVKLPLSCVSVTVELRGQVDVSHARAKQDAASIVAYLQYQGHISGEKPELPPALCEATPLAGVEPLLAPHAGVIVFHRQPGEVVAVGDAIVDIVCPITGEITTLQAQVAGNLFARTHLRYMQRGMEVAKIAGAVAYRSGNLLSA